MTFPGFTAEASLNKTSNHYLLHAHVYSPSNGSATVYPQACGTLRLIGCVGFIGTCSVGCALATGGIGTVGCIAACLALSGAAGCVDCLR